jgi:hypothetical protein
MIWLALAMSVACVALNMLAAIHEQREESVSIFHFDFHRAMSFGALTMSCIFAASLLVPEVVTHEVFPALLWSAWLATWAFFAWVRTMQYGETHPLARTDNPAPTEGFRIISQLAQDNSRFVRDELRSHENREEVWMERSDERAERIESQLVDLHILVTRLAKALGGDTRHA